MGSHRNFRIGVGEGAANPKKAPYKAKRAPHLEKNVVKVPPHGEKGPTMRKSSPPIAKIIWGNFKGSERLLFPPSAGSGSGLYSGGLTWSIVLKCDDHTGIFTCDGCARDPYFYVPAETQSYVIKLSCSR